MSETGKRTLLIEALIVWAAVVVGARLFYHLQSIRFVADNLMLFTSGLLLYVPALILYLRKEPFDFFEHSWSELFYSLRIALFVSLIIFPLILLGNHFLQIFIFHLRYTPASNKTLWETFLFHLLLVAFPEEFFFRGYLLRRFRQVFEDRFTFLGVKMGKAFFFTALLFAFSHSIVVLRWWHFSIFFPALAFGWLREKTHALTAAILFHALTNVFSTWVGLHYR